jgi:phenylacetate-CoA ligase
MREAFPLIRYRTGDITMIKEGQCSCGRSHGRLEGLYGRIDEIVKIKGVSVSPERIRQILKHEGADTRIQIRIFREGPHERADVLLEVGEKLFFDEMRTQKAFMEKLEKALHSGTGVRMSVKIIPKSAFKGDALVVDERS